MARILTTLTAAAGLFISGCAQVQEHVSADSEIRFRAIAAGQPLLAQTPMDAQAGPLIAAISQSSISASHSCSITS